MMGIGGAWGFGQGDMSTSSQAQIYPTLFGRGPGRILPDLGRMRAALKKLGHPERDFPSILIVGTNGKGSTAAMLSSILQASGLRVGRYTSPHLVDVRERIVVGAERIPEEDFGEMLGKMESFPDLSFFETLTVMAFLEFSRRKVDVAVLEAGMGGRWDATRTAGSAIAGLSSVALDHSRWLGESIEEIAADKGSALAAAAIGIIAPSVEDRILPALGAPEAVRASRRLEVRAAAGASCEVRFPDGRRMRLQPPLVGAHQLSNLHLALALGDAASSLGWIGQLEEESVRRGLETCSWPGRLSEIRLDGHRVLLDGAHNAEAASALARELEGRDESYDLLFSCLDDKPVEEMAEILRPHCARVVICPLEDARAMALKRLQEAWPEALRADDPLSGLELLGERVVAAGSLRLVGVLMEASQKGVPDVE